MFCTQCGKDNLKEANFCAHCGHPLPKGEKKPEEEKSAPNAPDSPTRVYAPRLAGEAASRRQRRLEAELKAGHVEGEGDAPLQPPRQKPAPKAEPAPAHQPFMRPGNAEDAEQAEDAIDIPQSRYVAPPRAARPPQTAPAGTARPAARPPKKAEEADEARLRRPPRQLEGRVRQVPYEEDLEDEDEYEDEGRLFSPGIIAVIVVAVLVLGFGGWFFLTPSGQVWRASMNMNAPASAYWTLADRLMSQNQTTGAVAAYERAFLMDPDNFEGCVKLAKALELEGNTQRAANAYRKAIHDRPSVAEPYERLAKIYARGGMQNELAALLLEGHERTGSAELATMLNEIRPAAPAFGTPEGSYTELVSLAISGEEGTQVYYTLDGSEPTRKSTPYEGEIKLGDGSHTVRAIASRNGVASHEATARYDVSLPAPDVPVADPPAGRYMAKNGQYITVFLTAREDTTIYYTLDGSTPGQNARVYDPQKGIQLGVGKHTLKAGAMSPSGKASALLQVEYEVQGS